MKEINGADKKDVEAVALTITVANGLYFIRWPFIYLL